MRYFERISTHRSRSRGCVLNSRIALLHHSLLLLFASHEYTSLSCAVKYVSACLGEASDAILFVPRAHRLAIDFVFIVNIQTDAYHTSG